MLRLIKNIGWANLSAFLYVRDVWVVARRLYIVRNPFCIGFGFIELFQFVFFASLCGLWLDLLSKEHNREGSLYTQYITISRTVSAHTRKSLDLSTQSPSPPLIIIL